jgi:MFS family permease
MIRYLDFSYFWYMAITVSVVIFQLMFLPLLGKFSDRFGNVKLMKVSSLIIGLTTFLWIASVLIGNDLMIKIYLLILPGCAAGFGWAGYNLALNNYVYDAIGNRKRGFGLSYMNVLIGVGGFIGAGIGALIAWVDISFMNPMLFIFAISGFGRMLIAVYGSKFLHEVRNVGKLSSQFWIHEFTPADEVIKGAHNLEHLVEKVEHYILPEERKEFSKGKK